MPVARYQTASATRGSVLDSQIVNALFADAYKSVGFLLVSEEKPFYGSQSRPREGAQQQTSGRPAAILLVEDNPADVLLVQEALAENDVQSELFVATDGEEALKFLDQIDRFERPCPKLIILDLNLPKSTGHEVLQRIRSHGRCMRTQVVILSSAAPEHEEAAALPFGISRYIQKPCTLDDFLKIGADIKYILGSEHS